MKRHGHGFKFGLFIIAAICAFAGVMTAGGTTAYLTDNESASNIFTVGKVDASLNEPDFPGNDDAAAKDLVPNQEVPKNPSVTNTGDNDMLAFMVVEVPAEFVTLVADDGTKGVQAVTDLFWLKKNEDPAGTHANHFDENWIPLTSKTVVSTTAGTPSRYVFGYGSVLSKGESTTALFDKVQLKNIIENEITPGKTLEINVKAYAIQAANILEDDADLCAELGEMNLEKIYDIYLNQSGS